MLVVVSRAIADQKREDSAKLACYVFYFSDKFLSLVNIVTVFDFLFSVQPKCGYRFFPQSDSISLNGLSSVLSPVQKKATFLKRSPYCEM